MEYVQFIAIMLFCIFLGFSLGTLTREIVDDIKNKIKNKRGKK